MPKRLLKGRVQYGSDFSDGHGSDFSDVDDINDDVPNGRCAKRCIKRRGRWRVAGLRDRAAIVGVGYTPITSNSGVSTLTLAADAILAALADAGLSVHDVDASRRIATHRVGDSAGAKVPELWRAALPSARRLQRLPGPRRGLGAGVRHRHRAKLDCQPPRFMRSLAAEVPCAVALIRLEDGDDLLIYGNIVALDDSGYRGGTTPADPETIAAGMPVQAVFADVDDECTLVQWRARTVGDQPREERGMAGHA